MRYPLVSVLKPPTSWCITQWQGSRIRLLFFPELVFLLTQQWKNPRLFMVCAEAEDTSINTYISSIISPLNKPHALFLFMTEIRHALYESRSLDSATTGQGVATIFVNDQATTSKGIQLLLMVVDIRLANNRMLVETTVLYHGPVTQRVLSEFQASTTVKKKCSCKKYADVCTIIQNIDK